MLEAKQRRAWMKSRRNKRKAARHARVRQQLIRYFLMLLLLGSSLVFLTHTTWHLQDLDRDLQVVGNQYSSTDKIKNIVSKYLYMPVFQIDPQQVEKEVEELETVKFAFVRRYVFPHPKVIVKVKEEFPWARLTSSPDETANFVIAESGMLVPVNKFPHFPQPKLLVCLDAQKASEILKAQDVRQWATWLAYLEKQTEEEIVLLDLRRQFDVRVTTNKTVFRLGIPDTTLTQRLGRLASIYSSIEKHRENLDYVDLALDNNIPLKLTKKVEKTL